MTSSDQKRVQEEIKAVRRLSSGRITLRMENGKVLVALPGPKETPWANGLFSLIVSYPTGIKPTLFRLNARYFRRRILTLIFISDYPKSPPVVSFSPSISHPNVFDSGLIGLEILDSWKSTYTLIDILNETFKILKAPNVSIGTPSNLEATFNFLENKSKYEEMANSEANNLAPKVKRNICV